MSDDEPYGDDYTEYFPVPEECETEFSKLRELRRRAMEVVIKAELRVNRNKNGNVQYAIDRSYLALSTKFVDWIDELCGYKSSECEFCGDRASKVETFDRPVYVCDKCSAEKST